MENNQENNLPKVSGQCNQYLVNGNYLVQPVFVSKKRRLELQQKAEEEQKRQEEEKFQKI